MNTVNWIECLARLLRTSPGDCAVTVNNPVLTMVPRRYRISTFGNKNLTHCDGETLLGNRSTKFELGLLATDWLSSHVSDMDSVGQRFYLVRGMKFVCCSLKMGRRSWRS